MTEEEVFDETLRLLSVKPEKRAMPACGSLTLNKAPFLPFPQRYDTHNTIHIHTEAWIFVEADESYN